MKKNILTNDYRVNDKLRKKHCFRVVEPVCMYQSKSTGKPTSDIDDALLDSFGRPITLGYSDEVVQQSQTAPLCLDPSNPIARARALESRARMDNMSLLPTIYEDNFTAMQYAENSSNALADAIEAKLNNNN